MSCTYGNMFTTRENVSSPTLKEEIKMLKNQKFGVEIEMTGTTRENVATSLQSSSEQQHQDLIAHAMKHAPSKTRLEENGKS